MTTNATTQSKKDSGLALVGAAASTVANFAVAALVALDGKETAGIFFATTAIISICSKISSLGAMTGLVYFMPNELAGNNGGNPKHLLALAVKPVIITAGSITALVIACSLALNSFLSNPSSIVEVLPIAAFAIPAWALMATFLGSTRGLGTMLPTVSINQIFRPTAQLIFLTAAVLLSDSLTILLSAWALPLGIGALLAWLATHKAGGSSNIGTPVVAKSDFWTYTKPRAVSNGFQIMLERLDVILVLWLAGEAAAGIYGAVTRYITAGNFLIASIAQANAPSLRKTVKLGDKAAGQKVLHQTTNWMVLLIWPFALFLLTKAETFAELLNKDFIPGAQSLQIIAIGLMVSALAGPIEIMLLMIGRSKRSLLGVSVALFLDIGLSVLLIPHFGIEGAAIAWSIAIATQNLLAAFFVGSLARYYSVSKNTMLAIVGACIAVLPIALTTPATFTGLFLSLGVSGIIWLAWCFFFATAFDLPLDAVKKIKER